MNYLLKAVAVFLLCFGFSRADLCQNKFVVQSCTDNSKFEPNLNAFEYSKFFHIIGYDSLSLSLSLVLFEQPTSLLCPQTRTINGNSITSIPEWRVMSSTSGKFCTAANYSVNEMCVVENSSSTLVIDDDFFTGKTMGELTVYFVRNVTVFSTVTIRYGKNDIIYYYVIDISL